VDTTRTEPRPHLPEFIGTEALDLSLRFRGASRAIWDMRKYGILADDTGDYIEWKKMDYLLCNAALAIERCELYMRRCLLYDPDCKEDPDFEVEIYHPKGWATTMRRRDYGWD